MWCGFVSVLVAGIAWADGISGSVSSGGAALIHSHNDYARERPFWRRTRIRSRRTSIWWMARCLWRMTVSGRIRRKHFKNSIWNRSGR